MKDKNKIITFIIVIALLFIGLFFFGKPDKNKNSAISANDVLENAQEVDLNAIGMSNTLTAEEKLYDFGNIGINNGDVEKIFKITNPSKNDINLKNIYTSCMCTTAYLEILKGEKGPFGMAGHGGAMQRVNEIIKAGESRNLRVVYDPMAHGPSGVGMVDRFIYLEDDFGNILELEIKATVTP